jgi:hypothetical protein
MTEVTGGRRKYNCQMGAGICENIVQPANNNNDFYFRLTFVSFIVYNNSKNTRTGQAGFEFAPLCRD